MNEGYKTQDISMFTAFVITKEGIWEKQTFSEVLMV